MAKIRGQQIGIAALIVTAIAGGIALWKRVKPPPTVCTPGETKCVGTDLYTCNLSGQWEPTETDSPYCITPPPNFSVSQATWDAPMPFAPDSGHVFTAIFTNLSDKRFLYRMEVYWVFELVGSFGGSVSPGGTGGGGTKVSMPSELGIYNLTIKLWIDDTYVGEFVVSEVVVAILYIPTFEDCDINGDGAINVLDMILVGQHYGETGILGWIVEDINHDGIIDQKDQEWIEYYWTG